MIFVSAVKSKSNSDCFGLLADIKEKQGESYGKQKPELLWVGLRTFFSYIGIIPSVWLQKNKKKTPKTTQILSVKLQHTQQNPAIKSHRIQLSNGNIKGYIEKFGSVNIPLDEGQTFGNQLCFHFLSSQDDLHGRFQVQNTAVSLQNRHYIKIKTYTPFLFHK